jgi:predicted transcriptional regulator
VAIIELEEQITKLLNENGPMMATQVAETVGYSADRTRYVLGLMRSEGIVDFSRKGGIWFLKEGS